MAESIKMSTVYTQELKRCTMCGGLYTMYVHRVDLNTAEPLLLCSGCYDTWLRIIEGAGRLATSAEKEV